MPQSLGETPSESPASRRPFCPRSKKTKSKPTENCAYNIANGNRGSVAFSKAAISANSEKAVAVPRFVSSLFLSSE